MLREGSVAEQGSHEELMRIEGGVYRNLWEAQLAADVKKGPEEGRTQTV